LRLIQEEGRGVLVYLRQEWRGVGLWNKLRAYVLQDQGLDTVEANLALGLPADARDYAPAAQILRRLGVEKVRLLTNNPRKDGGLSLHGVNVVARLPLRIPANPFNARYLATKRDRLEHQL
ncbi:MAG: GTP cyclohydrolase II RibA, partial [Clostridia bacterium]|nr:GTP cyclohydrolase II RibA [Clostridia bacterium]